MRLTGSALVTRCPRPNGCWWPSFGAPAGIDVLLDSTTADTMRKKRRVGPRMHKKESPTRTSTVVTILTVLLAATLQGTASAQTRDPLPHDSLLSDPARDAYLDDTARRLVLGAKAARETARLTIDAYTALIRERLGFEMSNLRRDQPWMHGERTVRMRWSREERLGQ